MKRASGKRKWEQAAKRAASGAGGNGENAADRKTKREHEAMASIGKRINDLIEKEDWQAARALIENELRQHPNDHWLLTQLGETYYEQKKYSKALEHLLKSREIVPDCPFTLWHLAGALDALGYHSGALSLYTWLLESKRTHEDDPCWESKEWTDSLKTDCVYRMGICFKNMNKREKAANCFRQYIQLLSMGMPASYPIDEALRQIKLVDRISKETRDHELQKATRSLATGKDSKSGLPRLNPKKLRELQEA